MPERSKMRFFSTQCEEGEKLPNGFVAAFRGQLSTAGLRLKVSLKNSVIRLLAMMRKHFDG